MGILCNLFLLVVIPASVFCGEQQRPNIIFFVSDDMGWNDVSFHGSDQIPTPNLDLLAYSGIALERHYVHGVCTPSRAALLSGKFAYKTGMQGYPILHTEDRGLLETEKLLPQYLKELGYTTHLVGKWHLGASRTKYIPTNRGFDTHFGHRIGSLDYYEYNAEDSLDSGNRVSGSALYRDLNAAWDVEGYITNVYTEEAKSIIKYHNTSKPLFLMVSHQAAHTANEAAFLQAPPEYVRAMRHIKSPGRRIFAGIVKKLDESIGDIAEALLQKQILHNTIIIFTSDNGAPTSGITCNYGSNWPLRGLKMTPFEGAIRVGGLLWTANLCSNHLWKGYMHLVDWLPTLLRAAGAEPPLGIDGIDLWDKICSNKKSLREEIFEIDDYSDFASIISGDYKLVIGNVDLNKGNHQGKDLRENIGKAPSYMDSIKSSKMYTILNKIGKPFKTEDSAIRQKIKVNCGNKAINEDRICFPKHGKVCLFNIQNDPCETEDFSGLYPHIVDSLLHRLMIEMKKTVPRIVPYIRDPRSDPKYFNYTWSTFADGCEEAITHAKNVFYIQKYESLFTSPNHMGK